MARQIEVKESEIYADVICDEGSERNALVLLKEG